VKGTVTFVEVIADNDTVVLNVPPGMPFVKVAGPETVAPVALREPVALTVIVVLTGVAACAPAPASRARVRTVDMRNIGFETPPLLLGGR